MSNSSLSKILKTPEISSIFKALGENSNQVRIIGGCIRDTLLKIPNYDIDIATSHLPTQTIKLLKNYGIKTIPTGLAHGTITAIIGDKKFEITTLRIDQACNGRHAIVSFSDNWQADALRRDFTINALSADIDGKIYDYCGGLEDLAQKKVKFIGDACLRLSEDYLRMLRYFRFCAHIQQKSFDESAISAITKVSEHMTKISGERVRQEFFKLLSCQDPILCLKQMQACNITTNLFGTDTILNYAQLKKLLSLEKSMPSNSWRRFAVLIYGISDLNYINQRFKFSNKELAYLETMLFQPLANNSKICKANMINLTQELSLDLVLIAASIQNIPSKNLAKLIALIKHWTIPIFPLKGEDLLQLQINGKELGRLLKRARKYWQDHDYQPTKTELIAYILK